MSDFEECERQGRPFVGTPQQYVDELTYRSYRWQRREHPEIPPTKWGKLFENAEALETRYQREATHAA